jgi:dCTP diphosphatase
MRDLQEEIQRFNAERGWLKHHDARSLTLAMTEELGELARLVAWEDQPLPVDAVAGEIADLLIYTLALANALDLDASDLVRRKLDENRDRFPV